MSRNRLVALLMLCLALLLTLVACGGDDDDGAGGSDEGQITETIQTVAIGSDPEDCTRLQTQDFVEQTTFTSGDEAIEACEQETSDSTDDPDSVEVTDISVDGETATANTIFTGGSFDGSTFSVALVNEDDHWKLDEVTDIPVFNVQPFQAALAEEIANDPELPPELGTCINDALATASEDQLRELLLAGDEDLILEIIGACIPAGA